MGNWTALLTTASQNKPVFLSNIASGRLTLPLNDAATFDCTFDVDSPELKTVLAMLDDTSANPGTPFIQLLEDGQSRFFGPLVGLDMTLEENGTVQASFTDPAGALSSVYAFADHGVTASATANSSGTTVTISNTLPYKGTRGVHRGMRVYLNGTDTGRTVSSIDGNTKVIISSALSVTSGNSLDFISPDVKSLALENGYGFLVDALATIGAAQVPLGRNGSFLGVAQQLIADGITVLDALKSLSDRDNGMDWYVSADFSYGTYPATIVIGDSPNPGVVTTTQLGSDLSKSVVFAFGPVGVGNIVSANVQHLPPVNTVYLKDDANRLKRQLFDQTSVGRYGEQGVFLSDLTRRTNFQAVADGLYRPAWRRTCSLVLEPTTCPRPWTDFYLGDYVTVDLSQSTTAMSSARIGKQRVASIEFNFDDSMIETGINLEFEVI